MSFYRAWQTGTIADGAKSTGEIDLLGNCDFVQVIFPSLTNGKISLQVSDTNGGTFQDLGSNVTTAPTSGVYSTTLNLGGYQYIKVVSSASQSGEKIIKVRGYSY